MYLHHFGLTHDPLGKGIKQTVSHQQCASLHCRLDNLMQTKGIGLITGDVGTGKTTALRQWCDTLNPLTQLAIYQADNQFCAFDIYGQLADQLGLQRYHRYSQLWRKLKEELLQLHDHKQITPVWILDEAQQLPTNFLLELPSFLNFSFDSRDILVIILMGTPQFHSLISRQVYSGLSSRILFHHAWSALETFDEFSQFVTTAFQQAGRQESILSQSGLKLIHLASRGRLRYAHKILTRCLQLAAATQLNHLPDDIVQQVIKELKTLSG